MLFNDSSVTIQLNEIIEVPIKGLEHPNPVHADKLFVHTNVIA